MAVSKTRAKLVDVARQLFAKNGVDDTTMNDIAVASKKGRRTLYTYFKSKEDIYMAVVESELEMLSGAMEKVAEQDIAPDTKILRLIETHLDSIKMVYYWENRQSLSEDSNIPAYILTIIKNKCLNYLRHQQIHEEYSDKIKDYYEWELNTRIATLQACEPYELFISEIQELVQQTLTDMPEKTRTIFMLSRYENKSYKEIAVLMNITPKGVDFHINKALKMLQTNLKDYFPLFLYFFMKCH